MADLNMGVVLRRKVAATTQVDAVEVPEDLTIRYQFLSWQWCGFTGTYSGTDGSTPDGGMRAGDDIVFGHSLSPDNATVEIIVGARENTAVHIQLAALVRVTGWDLLAHAVDIDGLGAINFETTHSLEFRGIESKFAMAPDLFLVISNTYVYGGDAWGRSLGIVNGDEFTAYPPQLPVPVAMDAGWPLLIRCIDGGGGG